MEHHDEPTDYIKLLFPNCNRTDEEGDGINHGGSPAGYLIAKYNEHCNVKHIFSRVEGKHSMHKCN